MGLQAPVARPSLGGDGRAAGALWALPVGHRAASGAEGEGGAQEQGDEAGQCGGAEFHAGVGKGPVTAVGGGGGAGGLGGALDDDGGDCPWGVPGVFGVVVTGGLGITVRETTTGDSVGVPGVVQVPPARPPDDAPAR